MSQNTFDNERLKNAIQKAESAFWASIAEDFPEIKTGDFPPLQASILWGALVDAVKTWLYLNGESK